MTEYTWRYAETDDGSPELESECALCGSEAPLAEFERMPVPLRGQKHNICEVCANTSCGSILDHQRGDMDTARMIAQTTNLILRKIE